VRNDLIVAFGRLNPRSACVLNTIITVFHWGVAETRWRDLPTQLGTCSVGCQVPVRSQRNLPAVWRRPSTDLAGT